MNPARSVCLVVCTLLLLGGPARAEQVTIETRDGQRYRGKLITQDDERVVLELRRGSITARVTIPRSEVVGPTTAEPAAPPTVHEARAERARGLVDPAERADALIALAQSVEVEGDPRDAADLYLEAGRADPARRDQTSVQAARALTRAGQHLRAEQVLEQALERNPKNAQARAAARQLGEAFAERARELIEPGVEAFLQDRPRKALRLLAEACEQLPTHVLDAASERIEAEAGLSLAQIMVDCRLRARCPRCEGAGVLECPAASKTDSYRCRHGRRIHHGRIEKVNDLRFVRWEECKRCDGMGHLDCGQCSGLGLHMTRPTRYERDTFRATLTEEMGALEARAESLTRRVEDDEREAAVRSVAATELLNLLQEIRAYSRSLAKLDSVAGARGGGDLRRKERGTAKRMASIMTALANALYVAGEQRYEDAVSHDGLLNEDGKLVPVAVRAMRARQAWEVVNQARLYTLEALELDPSTASPTKGDLRRRLTLMDQFLKRTWKTYLSLRAAEETVGDDLMKQALEQAAGGGR